MRAQAQIATETLHGVCNILRGACSVLHRIHTVCCMLHQTRSMVSCMLRVARCVLQRAWCMSLVARCVAHCPRLVSRALPKISVESAIVPAAIVAATKMIQRNKHTWDTTYRRLVPTAIIPPQNTQTIQRQSLQHRRAFPAVSEPTLAVLCSTT